MKVNKSNEVVVDGIRYIALYMCSSELVSCEYEYDEKCILKLKRSFCLRKQKYSIYVVAGELWQRLSYEH